MSIAERKQVVDILRSGDFRFEGDPATIRAEFDAMFAAIPRPQEVVIRRATVGGVDGAWFEPPRPSPNHAGLYLHGGGFVVGSAETYAALTANLAEAANIAIFSPDYRLAPEHPFPAAHEDVLAVYRGLLSENRSVSVVGDSAGGLLALGLLLDLIRAGLTLPQAVALWSPWLDLDLRGASHTFNREYDPSITTEGLHACRMRLVGQRLPDDPRTRPLDADLSGLPPVLVQAGSIEVLLSDTVELALRIARVGGDVDLKITGGAPHVFQSFGFMLEEGKAAIQETADFLNKHRTAP